MRRLLFVLVLLFVGCLLFGVGSGEGGSNVTDVKLNEPGTYPVVQEKVTIDVVTIYSSVESTGERAEAAFTEYLEDLTNVHVNWVDIIERTNSQEKINLMLASGDLPDVIMDPFDISAQQSFVYGLNGTFVALNSLIEERMPGLSSQLEQFPQYKAQLVMPDGNIYAFPDLEAGCYHCTMCVKLWMHQPWLDKLGLQKPETTEEFYQVLKAFKESDPNGNGLADEIPMMGDTTGWYTTPLDFIMNAFIYTRTGTDGGYLKREGQTLSFVANTDAWREGLKYLHRLYDEKLLAAETFVQKREQARAIVENPDIALVGCFPAGWYGVLTINGGDTGRFAEYDCIAPLEGPGGLRQVTYFPAGVRYHTFITKAAEHPEVIAQWVDWFYQGDVWEKQLLAYHWFKEGIDWRRLTDAEKKLGMLARDGTPGRLIALVSDKFAIDKIKDGWGRTSPMFITSGGEAMPSEWADDPSRGAYRNMLVTRNMMEPYRVDKHLPRNLVLDESVIDEIADLSETIAGKGGIVEQYSTEFIVGARDIYSDSAWQEYLTELENAGVDRYVDIWQQGVRDSSL